MVGRSATVVAVETLLVAIVFAAAPPLVVDGTTMEAFACIRVKIVSTGWMARVETPPEIQPAVKSIQDASLDMMIVCVIECTSATTFNNLVGRSRKGARKIFGRVSESER